MHLTAMLGTRQTSGPPRNQTSGNREKPLLAPGRTRSLTVPHQTLYRPTASTYAAIMNHHRRLSPCRQQTVGVPVRHSAPAPLGQRSPPHLPKVAGSIFLDFFENSGIVSHPNFFFFIVFICCSKQPPGIIRGFPLPEAVIFTSESASRA